MDEVARTANAIPYGRRSATLKSGPSTLDLLQKSFMQVCDGGEQVESQAKAFSTVAVGAAQDAKAFERSQHMFDADAA